MASIAVVAHREKLTKSSAGDLKSALARAGLADALWFEIDKGSAAEGVARKAIKQGAETIIVCGGDGTVRAAAAAIAHSGASLAVLPAGTANLFATGLDLPAEPEKIVDFVKREIGKPKEQFHREFGGKVYSAEELSALILKKLKLDAEKYLKQPITDAVITVPAYFNDAIRSQPRSASTGPRSSKATPAASSSATSVV